MKDNVVFFDLETSGLGPHTEIVQIGAVTADGRAEFGQFILPDGFIEEDATKVNGISKVRSALYKHGQEIRNVVKPGKGLLRFLKWLKGLKKTRGKRLLLVAHNGLKFDAPVLINNFLRHKVADLNNIRGLIRGFVDSMEALRTKNGKALSLQNLLKHFRIREIQSHDAVGDAKDLKEVMVRAQQHQDINSFLISNYVRPKEIALK